MKTGYRVNSKLSGSNLGYSYIYEYRHEAIRLMSSLAKNEDIELVEFTVVKSEHIVYGRQD